MRGQQCQLLALTPETWGQPRLEEQDMPVPPVPPLPAPSGHIMQLYFTGEPSNFVGFFFFWVFCFLPIVHSKSACPPTPHPPPRLPMLLTQALLCLLAHKYLQFRASMVPSTNRKEYSWESSVSLPYGSGALLPMQSQTHWAEGHLVREWLEQGSKEKVLQVNSCVENVPNIIVQPSSLKDWCKTVWPLISSVNLDWFPDIPCLAALLPITNHRKTTLFSQAAYKTCRMLCAPVKKGSPSPCTWENTAASLSFCTVTYVLCTVTARTGVSIASQDRGPSQWTQLGSGLQPKDYTDKITFKKQALF